MAKSCPKCGRPNAEQARKCIYCNTAFPELSRAPEKAESKAPSAPAPAKPQPAARPEAFQVVMSPVKTVDPDWLPPFCKLTGFDPHLAQQRFKSPAPWVVRVFSELAPAQEFVTRITQMGLDAYLLKQSGVAKLQDKLTVKGLRFQEEGIWFYTETGAEVAVRYADLFLIVRGRIQIQPEREDTEENPVEVSVGGLLVGAPGEGEENPDDPLVKLKQQLRRLKIRPQARHQRMFYRGAESLIMDIYLKTSAVGIRVMESEFDFSGMGERKQASAMLNFNTVFRDLVAHAPGVVVDENFNRISYVMTEAKEPDRVRSRLQEEIGISSNARKLYDNKAFFTDYSSRIYLHHLRAARLAKTAAAPPASSEG